jgi:myo-inositol 2-dehydrogenase / D-chiro-inositol 1-dehydrogenase
MMKSSPHTSRRQFIKLSLAGAAGVIAMPTIVPSSVFGAYAPSNKIHVAQIGCGRIANEMDLPGILRQDIARVVALCDIDSNRLATTRQRVEKHYKGAVTVKTFGDYRELLQDPGIDAVAVSTPDFWHSEPVVAAALAGKDVYVQKPLATTIHEGRQVSDTVTGKKRAFQIGSQQRSDSPWPQFRRACELVRNGRLGQLHTVKIGLLTDPSGGDPTPMPVPPNLNYAIWLGWTPQAPYTEERVHPQADFSRPGWLRIEPYCLGMITAWGSHHVDVAHWGMSTELTGPIEVEGTAVFPTKGLWNVHGAYHVEMKYANGVKAIIDDNFPNGVRFEGDEGWIFVSRGGARVTASDPKTGSSSAFAASNPSILKSKIKYSEIHLRKSTDHHLDWLQSIKTRLPAATTPEIAHRSTSACEVAWIAMKLGRKLRWNPDQEVFIGDDEANAMRSRPQRAPYGTDNVLKTS